MRVTLELYGTLYIAEHFFPALINGDVTGLSEQEITDLDAFERSLPTPVLYDFNSDRHFARDCVSGLLADCAEVRIYRYVQD